MLFVVVAAKNMPEKILKNAVKFTVLSQIKNRVRFGYVEPTVMETVALIFASQCTVFLALFAFT